MQDRDKEKVDANCLYETRLRLDCLIFLCPRRDLAQNLGQDHEPWCLILRKRDENLL